MKKLVSNPKDLLSGLIMVITGITFLVVGRGYEFGQVSRIGPGFFPALLAVLLVLVGLAVGVKGLRSEGESIREFAIKPTLLIVAATLAFGFLVRTAGLAVASAALVLIAAFASPSFRWTQGILLAIGLAALCSIVFVFALGLPIPVVGPLLSR